jgi:hypothetical protein
MWAHQQPQSNLSTELRVVQEDRLTWEILTDLEPQLQDLYDRLRTTRDNRSTRHFCANDVWFGFHLGRGNSYKNALSRLVGWYRVSPGYEVLFTSEAYEVAYRTLYGALPPCRNCGCS